MIRSGLLTALLVQGSILPAATQAARQPLVTSAQLCKGEGTSVVGGAEDNGRVQDGYVILLTSRQYREIGEDAALIPLMSHVVAMIKTETPP